MAGSTRSKRQKQQEKPDASSKRQKHEKTAADDDATDSTGIISGLFKKLNTSMGINANLDQMTIWEILTSHPLIRVGKFIFIPFLLYYARFYIRLQHPEYISKMTGGLINLRPAVHGTDTPRQVLIVATPGSGTVSIASELRKKLSLEIGHETTDAAWDFTRDGTVSWIHGIRYMIPPKDDHEKVRAIAKICNSDFETTHKNMGFHPAMYGPPRNKCSYRSKWDDCWQSECYVSLLKEWGCGLTNTCDIKFAKNIHQVRNPIKTLESLVVKYCIGGLDGIVAEPFLTYASALFPTRDFNADSCIEATGNFMVMYQEAMIKARLGGHLDSFYRIEKSTACHVAEAAGLLEANTTVYEPNHVRISRICDIEKKHRSPAQKIVEKKLNKVNKNQVQLGWMDLRGGKHGSKRKDGDRVLEGRVKNLFIAFKYDQMTVPLQYKPVDVHSEL